MSSRSAQTVARIGAPAGRGVGGQVGGHGGGHSDPRLDAQVDAQVDVVTPENVAFHYEVAGPFRRLPAYLLDLAIRVVLATALSIVAAFAFWSIGLPMMGGGVALFAWFVLGYFYGGLFETFWNGQTPGKRILGLRVLSVDGQPINALQAVLRNVLRDVDAMPFVFDALAELYWRGFSAFTWLGCYWLGLLTMAANDRYQRLGDLVCGTMVVVERRGWLRGVGRVKDQRAVDLAAALPVDFEISRDLGRALTAYFERRTLLAAARRDEIARHLAAPLITRFGLPTDTPHDVLLCALYHRAFIADGGERT
jgi:uncharacterized RDD family membrane protein YckC